MPLRLIEQGDQADSSADPTRTNHRFGIPTEAVVCRIPAQPGVPIETYPFLYSHGRRNWLWYVVGSGVDGGIRWLPDFGAGEWVNL